MLAPAGALSDERDLGLALARQHRLELHRKRGDRRARRLAQRWPVIAEDPGVAVLVGADRTADPDVVEHAREDRHRVLGARILGVRLDGLERRLRPDALDLELRDEDDRRAARALREHDGPFRREEPEPRQVADVVLVEDDVTRQAAAADELEEALAARLELRGGDPGERLGGGGRHLARSSHAASCRVPDAALASGDGSV